MAPRAEESSNATDAFFAMYMKRRGMKERSSEGTSQTKIPSPQITHRPRAYPYFIPSRETFSTPKTSRRFSSRKSRESSPQLSVSSSRSSAFSTPSPQTPPQRPLDLFENPLRARWLHHPESFKVIGMEDADHHDDYLVDHLPESSDFNSKLPTSTHDEIFAMDVEFVFQELQKSDHHSFDTSLLADAQRFSPVTESFVEEMFQNFVNWEACEEVQ